MINPDIDCDLDHVEDFWAGVRLPQLRPGDFFCGAIGGPVLMLQSLREVDRTPESEGGPMLRGTFVCVARGKQQMPVGAVRERLYNGLDSTYKWIGDDRWYPMPLDEDTVSEALARLKELT